MSNGCTHTKQIKFTKTDKDYCEDCVKIGDDLGAPASLPLVRSRGLLRLVQEQARDEALPTGRSVRSVRSIEPGESWVWCYADEVEAGEIRE